VCSVLQQVCSVLQQVCSVLQQSEECVESHKPLCILSTRTQVCGKRQCFFANIHNIKKYITF